MLTLLRSGVVAKIWPELKKGIAAGLPRGVECTEALLQNVLRAALCNTLRVWLLTEEDKGLCLVVTTTMTQDVCSPDKNLLIWSVYRHQTPSKRALLEAFSTLCHAAKGWGCKRLATYTQDEEVLKVLRQLSGAFVDTYVEVTI